MELAKLLKYEQGFVNIDDLRRTFHIATKDSTCYSAIQYYFRFLKLTDVELKGNDAEYRQQWFRKDIKPLFQKILFYLFVHGYCGYTKTTKKYDQSRNEEWMAVNKEIRDAAKEDYNLEQIVVNIPDWDAYTHKMKRDTKTLKHKVYGTVDNHEEDLFQERKRRRNSPIQILTSSKYDIPFFSNGMLRGPVATLIAKYEEMRQLEQFNITASYQLSHPIVFWQYQQGMKEEELLSRVKSATFGESAMNAEKEKQLYLVFQEGNKVMEEEIEKTNSTLTTRMADEKAYYKSDGTIVPLTTILDRKVNMPPGKEVSKANGPVAVPPQGLVEMNHQWIEKVANVSSLPYSLLSKDKIGGGNAAKQFADADLKMLQKTIADLSMVMEEIFEQLYDVLEMDKSEKFVLHPQPFVDFEMLLAIFDHGLIDKQQLQIEIEDSYALKRNKNIANTSATYEMLDNMKKNEAIGPKEYKIGMKKIYGLDFNDS